ncbi:hypothetical protein [Kitasatospora sp. NPDC002040]|uniref:hypothetical protein n=1 Tax=Kitasatospora sp. NPDC002040 TaxID=3154661 RepID=UPI0033224D7A
MYVSSASQAGNGITALAVSATKVTCSQDGLDPLVEGTGAEARTVQVVADAEVHLLTPEKQLKAGTAADLPKLFAAHAASQNSSGAFGWHGNIFTVRLNPAGRVNFIGQGPWSSLNATPSN